MDRAIRVKRRSAEDIREAQYLRSAQIESINKKELEVKSGDRRLDGVGERKAKRKGWANEGKGGATEDEAQRIKKSR